MMKNKIFVASSVFLVLFLSFWQFGQIEKREFSLIVHDKELEEIIQSENELDQFFQNKTQVFESREYVKIKRVL
ncbi:MAG: hypothetical protein ABF649_09150 [Bacillus sp. (in: firmicutes)]